MRNLIIIIIILLFVNSLFSQNNDTSQTNNGDSVTNVLPTDTSEFDFFYTEEEEIKYLNFKPIFGLGVGTMSYLGDVKDVYQSTVVGKYAYNLTVSKGIRSFLNVDFNIIKGTFTGNEWTQDRNLNFKSEFLSGGVSVSYNFEHLLKKEGMLLEYRKQRKVIPYLSLGLETFAFNSKADLKDANGYYYNYWSDGTIRNIAEGSAPEEQSIMLVRDYSYETDLREMNNDELGKYSLQAFAIPVDASVELQLHERVQLRLGATYHYALNDLIDDISSSGQGIRAGNGKSDSYLYTYFTFRFDIFSSNKEIEEMFFEPQAFDSLLFASIDFGDEDNDGVLDFNDDCIGTPTGVSVNPSGCPIDTDKDGIPDFKDKEANTPLDSIVSVDGVMLTNADKTEDTTRTRIYYWEICDYYPSMCGKEIYRLSNEELPVKYLSLDENEDGYISVDEVSIAIDEFFDMKSDFNIDDIYELIEFFFSQ
jgi:hypothetical protein